LSRLSEPSANSSFDNDVNGEDGSRGTVPANVDAAADASCPHDCKPYKLSEKIPKKARIIFRQSFRGSSESAICYRQRLVVSVGNFQRAKHEVFIIASGARDIVKSSLQ
jgi:hypothetical protein